MKKVKRLTGAAAIVGAVVAFAVMGSSASSASPKPFLVGSPTDLTGQNAPFAQSWQAGLNAAVAALNDNGGILGRKVQVQYQDLQSDPARASVVVTQMATSKKYNVLIPTTAGNDSLPIAQAAARAKQFLVGGVAFDGLQNPANYPTEFDSNTPSAEESAASACMVQKLKYKKIAIATLSDPFSESQATTLANYLKRLGIQVTGQATWDFTATDITPQLQQLKSGNPDAVFVISYSIADGVFFSSLKNLGWNVPIIGGISLSSDLQSQVDKAGTVPATIYAVGHPSQGKPAGPNAVRAIKYLKSAGHITTFTRALTGYLFPYDALMMVAAAAKQAKSINQAALIKAMEQFSVTKPQTLIANQPVPKVSSKIHALNGLTYSIVNAATATPNGTESVIAKIPHCIVPTLKELQG